MSNMKKATHYIYTAALAFKDGDVEEAEYYLRRAQNTYPSLCAKKLLNQIQTFKLLIETNNRQCDSNISKDNKNHTNTKKYVARKRIIIAKSKKEIKVTNNDSIFGNNSPEISSISVIFNSLEADKCIQIAENAFSVGNLNRAEDFLLKAQSYCSSNQAQNLLKEVLNEKCLFENNSKLKVPHCDAAKCALADGHSKANPQNPLNIAEETNQSRVNTSQSTISRTKDPEAAKKYGFAQCQTNDLDKAEKAIASGNITEAKHILINAEIIYPSLRGKLLLKRISNLPEGRDFEETSETEECHRAIDDDYNNDQAKKCIATAEEAISYGKIEKAKRFLMKADRFCPSRYTKEILTKLDDKNTTKTDKLRQAVENDYYNALASYWIDKAEKAILNSDITMARRYLTIADKLSPSQHAKDLLKKISNKPEDTNLKNSSKTKDLHHPIENEFNEAQASICIDKAEKAILSENMKRAKRFLKKAEKLFPSQHAKNLLKKISAKSKDSSLENTIQMDEANHSATTNIIYNDDDIYLAKFCVDIAEKAILLGNINNAKQFLNKAEHFCPSQRAKDLLRNVLDKTENNFNFETKTKTDDESIIGDQSQADNCIYEAEEAMKDGNIKKAETFLNIAESFCPSQRAKDLLKQINDNFISNGNSRTEENNTKSKNYMEQPQQENNIIQAEKCIEVAQDALLDRDFKKARRFLLKAERFFSTIRAIDLLHQVDAAEAAAGPDRQTKNDTKRDTSNKNSDDNGRPNDHQTQRRGRQEATADQIAAVKRVKVTSTDLYEVLGVPKGSSVAAIKKQFRALQLLLHPDRNPAPGAEKAYLAVREAFHSIKNTMQKS